MVVHHSLKKAVAVMLVGLFVTQVAFELKADNTPAKTRCGCGAKKPRRR